MPAVVSLSGTGESLLWPVHDPEGGGLRAGPLGGPLDSTGGAANMHLAGLIGRPFS
jgi:hypothetical protein